MSKVYPKRPYTSTAEVAVGDVVRMRHDDDLHQGVSPAFDDCVIAALTDEGSATMRAVLKRPFGYVWTDGTFDCVFETFEVELIMLINRFDVLTTGSRGAKDTRRRLHLHESGYYTVVIPYSDKPTEWHPTECVGPFSVLTRGAFTCESDAETWATKHLNGQPYDVRRIAGEDDRSS